MSFRVRILIAIGGIIVFAFIIFSIRKSKMVIADSVFWFLFSLFMLIIGVFPELFFAIARLMHVSSASNLAYLVLITLLLIRVFQQDMKISQLQTRLLKMVQEVAIQKTERNDASKDASQD